MLPWDANLWRGEAGAGYSLRRNVILKGSYQYDRRDGGHVTAAHLAAAQTWRDGRMDDSIARYARIVQDHPTDLFALQTAHVGCFFIGRQSELRDWPLQAMRAQLMPRARAATMWGAVRTR